MPYWEDTEPRLSPDGAQVAYADDGYVCLAPVAGGPPRRLLEADGPVWIDDATLLVEHRARRHVAARRRGRRRPVAAPARRRRRARRRVGAGRYRPTAPRSHSSSRHAPTSTAPRSASPRSRRGAVRALTGTPRMQDRAPAWSPDGSDARVRVRALGHVGAARRRPRRDRRAAADRRRPPTTTSRPGTRTAARILVHARRAEPPRPRRSSTPASGAVHELAAGGIWSAPQWTAAGGVIATYEDHATPPELRLADAAAATRAVRSRRPRRRRTTRRRAQPCARCSRPPRSPSACAARPPRGRQLQLARRARDPRLPVPARGTRRRSARRRDRLSARRPDRRLRRRVGRPRAVLHRQGLRLARAQLPRLDRLRARVRARATTASGASRTCGTASPRPTTCARSTGSTASGSAIFGASYGSYMALLSVTDDPEYRFRCAVAKYGDCDILTSWSQGDREGVQDLERMMGHPSTARAAYRAGSPVHRLEQVQAPLLIAHGERDERVSPKQSEELVAALRRLGQDVRVPDLPDRGARPPARRPPDPLLPPARTFSGLVPDLTNQE